MRYGRILALAMLFIWCCAMQCAGSRGTVHKKPSKKPAPDCHCGGVGK